MATIEYYKDDSDTHEWRWRVTADGDIVGRSSEGYTRKENAEKNLASLPGYATPDNVRTASAGGSGPVGFYEDDKGQVRWNITASNGEIVGASHKGFDDQAAAEANLADLVAAAKDA